MKYLGKSKDIFGYDGWHMVEGDILDDDGHRRRYLLRKSKPEDFKKSTEFGPVSFLCDRTINDGYLIRKLKRHFILSEASAKVREAVIVTAWPMVMEG